MTSTIKTKQHGPKFGDPTRAATEVKTVFYGFPLTSGRTADDINS